MNPPRGRLSCAAVSEYISPYSDLITVNSSTEQQDEGASSIAESEVKTSLVFSSFRERKDLWPENFSRFAFLFGSYSVDSRGPSASGVV
jgi:hypothetical protein